MCWPQGGKPLSIQKDFLSHLRYKVTYLVVLRSEGISCSLFTNRGEIQISNLGTQVPEEVMQRGHPGDSCLLPISQSFFKNPLTNVNTYIGSEMQG